MALALACGLGGCAMSNQLGSVFNGDEPKTANAKASKGKGSSPDDEVTGSIAASTKTGLPPEIDLAFTRAAVTDVFTRGGKDTSAPWENPRTGARGTVTPIAIAYTLNGITCHDFLASYVATGAEAWMQGEACRAEKGGWEVKSLRPWRRT